MKKLFYFFLLIFSLNANGQSDSLNQNSGPSQSVQITEKVEMADKFRADGKIYVVITVVLIIFLGMLFYIFTLEKKIRRIEKEIDSKK